MDVFQLNLRQAIIQRVQNKDEEQLQEIIEGSVDGDERALPGLGVLFEMIWKNSDSDMRRQLLTNLEHSIPNGKEQ